VGSSGTIRFSRVTVLYAVRYPFNHCFRCSAFIASNEGARPTVCCVGSRSCLQQDTFSLFSQDIAVTGGTSDGAGFGIRSMGRNLSKKTAFKTPDKEFSNLNSLADGPVEVSRPICSLQPRSHLIYARPIPIKRSVQQLNPQLAASQLNATRSNALVASNSGRTEFKSRYVFCCTSWGPNRLFITVCTTVRYFFSVLSHIHPPPRPPIPFHQDTLQQYRHICV